MAPRVVKISSRRRLKGHVAVVLWIAAPWRGIPGAVGDRRVGIVNLCVDASAQDTAMCLMLVRCRPAAPTRPAGPQSAALTAPSRPGQALAAPSVRSG